MWLSEERSRKAAAEAAAEWGAGTIGDTAAVYLAGERRQVPVCCPGGYTWRPAVGEQVLVLKAGQEGEQPCILGKAQREKEDGLQPGQVCISGSECSILWGNELQLAGEIQVNGEPLEGLIRRVVNEMLGMPGEETTEGEGT